MFRRRARRFKGGGGPSHKTSTVTSSDLPAYVQDEFEALLRRSEFESLQPYQPYGQSRLAGYSPAEQFAMQGITNIARVGDPRQVRQGTQMMEDLPTAMNNSISNTYMSPYFEQALDPAKREVRRESAMMGRDIKDEAARRGGLGGYREAIMQTERMRNRDQQLGDMEYKGRQDAFMDASNRFNQDRTTRMEQSRMLNEMGQARQAAAFERLNALRGVGADQRGMQQASMDIGYEDFLRQQGYPNQQLGIYGNMLHGSFTQPDKTVSQYQQRPGLFSQSLGLGLGGLGMFNAMGGGAS